MRLRSAFLTTCALAALVPPAADAARRPTAAETVAAARTLGGRVGEDAARIQKRFLPGARMVPVKGAGSKLGGRPALPIGVKWPTCHGGHRLSLLAQLDLRELEAAVPGATRARGTLAVFASQVVDPKTGFPEIDPWAGWLRPGACLQVRYWPRTAQLGVRATPSGVKAFPSTPFRLRPTLTVPDTLLVGSWLGRAPSDSWLTLVERAAWGDLRHAPPDLPVRQVLGWSIPIQEDPTATPCPSAHVPKGPQRLLLQLDADEERLDFDDASGGQLLVTIPAADLRAGRFDRLCGEYQID